MPLHSTRPHSHAEDPDARLAIRPQFAAPEVAEVPRNRLPPGEMDRLVADAVGGWPSSSC